MFGYPLQTTRSCVNRVVIDKWAYVKRGLDIMRDLLKEISDFINDCYPIIVIVTWLLLVIVVIKMLVTGAIR